MTKMIRRITSLLLTLVLTLLVFVPTAVSASGVAQMEAAAKKYLTPSDGALFSVKGKNLSKEMYEILTAKSMTINDDTLIELVTIGANEATVLVATNTDGGLVTRNILMGIGEDGKPIAYTAAELDPFYMSGGNAMVDPFDDSLQITFLISFYAHGYAGYSMGAAQPQVAMFIYNDDSNSYNVSYLSMTYICTGTKGYFDANDNFVSLTGPLDYFSHRISVSQTNPRRNSYYSASNPFNTYYILIHGAAGGGQAGAHMVEYTIRGTKPNGSSFNITDSLIVTELYNPN